MKNKFNKICDFCGDLLENRKGVVKLFEVIDYGETDNPKLKRTCWECKRKFSDIYGARK